MIKATLLMMSSLLLLAAGCAIRIPQAVPGQGFQRLWTPNRPTPGRTATRKVDAARAKVERACRMAEALGLPQTGCDEAEAILDLPRQAGAR